jgi:uncharacterized membrane protein
VNLLTVHLWVAFVVALVAVLGVWRRSDRRIALYVVTLQILIGIALVTQGLRAPSIHYGLAVLGWAGYMAANAVGRRPTRHTLALAIAGVSSLLILCAYFFGMEAVKHGYTGG